MESQDDERRVLKGFGGILRGTQVLYERSDEGEFHVIGSPQDLHLDRVAGRLLSVLSNDWKTQAEVTQELDAPVPSGEQIRKALSTFLDEGEVERDPKDRRPGSTLVATVRVISNAPLPLGWMWCACEHFLFENPV